MSPNAKKIKEEILYVCWKNLALKHGELTTQEGDKVTILDVGEQNHLDGPDFQDAKIRIGGLTHYGAVEIHTHSKDWYVHGHHLDKNYNNVVLHVVAESRNITKVTTSLGHQIPTLNIIDHLPVLYTDKIEDGYMPCTGNIISISKEVFDQQIKKASEEYLAKKVEIFFEYFDPHTIPSESWKHALFITLCDALGVPSNRDPMKEAATSIITYIVDSQPLDEEIEDRLIQSLLSELDWKRKGNRQSNFPEYRLKQAIDMYIFIQKTNLDYFFSTKINVIWEDILEACTLNVSTHNHRLFVSFFLPALYALGIIFHSQGLKHRVYEIWNTSKIKVPCTILRKFGLFNKLTDEHSLNKIGLIYQYNAYCKTISCARCKILNNIISS